MSLTKETLEQITSTAIAAAGAIQSELPANMVAAPASFELIDLQHLQQNRRRFTGKLKTSSITDFASYVKSNSKGKAKGFISPDNLECTLFFNLGTTEEPEHGDWTASLSLEMTAAYRAMLGLNGKKLTQRDASEWLEDWQDFITPYACPEGSTYGTLGKAIQAIRDITIKRKGETSSVVGDFSGQRSAMEQVEADSRQKLPAAFGFFTEPYQGLLARSFLLRLQVLTAGDDPILVFRIVKLEAHGEAIGNDFKNRLSEELADQAELTIGTFTVGK